MKLTTNEDPQAVPRHLAHLGPVLRFVPVTPRAASLVIAGSVMLTSVGCTARGTSNATDGGVCPENIPCNCDCPSGYDGGTCVCQNFSEPVCPVTYSESQLCDSYDAASCMGCYQGAGFTCRCSDAGAPGSDGGGPWLECVGTGYACTGGTF